MPRALGQEIRLFELEEAERMLPLVRAIVKGMMDDYTERQSVLERLEPSGPVAAEPDVAAAGVLQREADTLTEKLIEASGELEDLGVEFKGIELGLVDFPALRDGEIVYLCWQYGEDRIAFWHPLETGYAGRRPIERD
jgi:hypothetical protein